MGDNQVTESRPSVHRLYLEASAGQDSIERLISPEGLDTDYFQTSFRLGYEPTLVFRDDDRFRGKLLLDLGYSFVGGDEGNLGSHRHQGEFLTGWKQHVFSVFYAQAKLGLGIARNSLDFGEGFPLDVEHSLNLLWQTGGGLEFCFNDGRSCGGPFGGYFWERSIAGGPDYLNQGWLAGLRVSFDPVPVPPPRPIVVTKIVREQVIVKVVETVVEKEPEPPQPTEPPKPIEKSVVTGVPSWSTVSMIFFFTNDDTAVPLGEDSTGGRRQNINLQLDRIAEYMRKNPDMRFFLHGYANRTGSENRNRVLSLERVEAVRDYLIQKRNVSGERLLFEGRYLPVGRSKKDAEGTSVHGSVDPECDKADSKHGNNRCVVIKEMKE